ncbi:MAG: hypothetical protein WCK49_08895 [Myxococcaceae bacterium]
MNKTLIVSFFLLLSSLSHAMSPREDSCCQAVSDACGMDRSTGTPAEAYICYMNKYAVCTDMIENDLVEAPRHLKLIDTACLNYTDRTFRERLADFDLKPARNLMAEFRAGNSELSELLEKEREKARLLLGDKIQGTKDWLETITERKDY